VVRVDQGNTGQLLVTIRPVAKPRVYELRYAAVPAAAGVLTWTTTLLATAKPSPAVNNLTPGVTYTFQVRAFGKLDYSEWSALVQRMCI